MAWTDGTSRATGYLITAANWNDLLGASGSLMQLKSHAHGGTTGEGSTSIGALVLGDFTDAAAPAAPGAGKTRLYAVSGKFRLRAGASGVNTGIVPGEAGQATVGTVNAGTEATTAVAFAVAFADANYRVVLGVARTTTEFRLHARANYGSRTTTGFNIITSNSGGSNATDVLVDWLAIAA